MLLCTWHTTNWLLFLSFTPFFSVLQPAVEGQISGPTPFACLELYSPRRQPERRQSKHAMSYIVFGRWGEVFGVLVVSEGISASSRWRVLFVSFFWWPFSTRSSYSDGLIYTCVCLYRIDETCSAW